MADLDTISARLAALDPAQRARLQAELSERGIRLPQELQSSDETEAASRRSATFSLFFFSAEERAGEGGQYKLLLEAAELADRRGFEAVWTPERHFHSFGGPYPAPALLAAALATRTRRISLRAGSLVLPLHDPIRVAEEWAVVDNLSGGRAGVAFASGFHPIDFVFAPDDFAQRREVLRDRIDTVHRLWRGEALERGTGTGTAEVRSFPRPVQSRLPTWLTVSGDSDRSFEVAGQLGVNVLTALLNQSLEQLKRRISLYRRTLAEHGHDPESSRVTVMLHTFVGEEGDDVREIVREPFRTYLRTHLDLARSLAASLSDTEDLSAYADHEEDLLEFGFLRYVENASLVGTAEECRRMVRRLEEAGVDEIAALVDFGVADRLVMESIERLAGLREALDRERGGAR